MSKLGFLVCENFAPELLKIISDFGEEEVSLEVFPCICTDKKSKEKAVGLLDRAFQSGKDVVLMCGRYCTLKKELGENRPFEIITGDYCYHHLLSPELEKYINEKGGFVVTLGWLQRWRENMAAMGFNEKVARMFYRDGPSDILFLDAGLDEGFLEKSEEFAAFIDRPYTVVKVEVQPLKYIIGSIVSRWKLRAKCEENQKALAESQKKCAEYAAVLNILGDIAGCSHEEEILENVKMIFVRLMGANTFRFHQEKSKDLPQVAETFFHFADKKSLLLEDQNKFMVPLRHGKEFYGIFEVGGFLFPQYIERYVWIAEEIAQITALRFANIAQYSELLRHKKEIEHKTNHDALTGLFNRTYLEEKLNDLDKDVSNICVLYFDLDGLKVVNDRYGHSEGDKLIKAAAGVLKRSFDPQDLLIRLGGDEFIAIVKGCRTGSDEKERVQNEVAKYNDSVSEKHLTLYMSVGLAAGQEGANTVSDLIKKADFAMYQDKVARQGLRVT